MIHNKKLNSIVMELFIRSRKVNISIVFITQSYFKVPKYVRLNTSHFFYYNDNREDDVKAEEYVKAENGAENAYIGDEYKDTIGRIFKYGLTDGGLHLSYFDNRQFDLTDMVEKISGKIKH